MIGKYTFITNTGDLKIGSGHLNLSGNTINSTGIVENIQKYIDTNYNNYIFNNVSYKLEVEAKVLPF